MGKKVEIVNIYLKKKKNLLANILKYFNYLAVPSQIIRQAVRYRSTDASLILERCK